MSKGIVNLHGKAYKTVVLRVNEFREKCSIQDGWGISTRLLHDDAERVVVQAWVYDPGGRVVGSGLAEEYRNASKINRTSAMEVAETSAIGRALASIGLGGEEYCSADELLNALEQQKSTETAPAATENDSGPDPVMDTDDDPDEVSGDSEQDSEYSKDEKIQGAFKNLYDRGMKIMGLEEFTSRVNFIMEHGYGGKAWKELPVVEARRFYADVGEMIKTYQERGR